MFCLKQILSRVRSACDKYSMIGEGDRIAVGVSGGKDSVALLVALAEMRRFYPKRYEVEAIMMDPCFDGAENDYTLIEELCKKINVDYRIKRTNLWQVVFDERKESNPCSLCAKMRRGILHDMCIEDGCNKLALGHHLDDAAETFFINLLSGGSISCFSPVTYLSRKDLYVIRPLVLTKENMVESAVRRLKLPIVKSRCPSDKCSERQTVKLLIKELENDYPALREKIISAMQKGKISGWDERN